MRFIRVAALAGLLAAAPCASAQQTPEPLTLDRAKALALAQPSALSQAEIDARIAEEGVTQARAAFLPTLSAPLAYTFTSPLHGPEQHGVPYTERPPAFVANNGVNEYFLVANAAGEIDVNGRLRAELDQRRAELARAEAAALVARRGVVSAVTESFYGLALAHAKRRIAADAVAAAEDFLRLTKLMLEGGEVAEVDTIRARVDVAARRDELLQAEAAERSAAETLNALTGQQFGIVPDVESLDRALPLPNEVSGLTAEAVAKRPELAALDAEARAAEAAARAAHAERLPSLSYSVSAGVDDTAIEPSRDLGAAAVVSLNVPIFNWGASKSRQREAELRREQAEQARRIAERQYAQAFFSARAETEAAAARVRLLASSVADALRALDISMLRYRAGEASMLEVTDARATLATQRAAYYQAIFDYRITLDHLRLAVGQ